MKNIYRSTTFKNWLSRLKDATAKAKIEVRIRRFANGNPGDYRNLKDGGNV